MFSQLLRHFRVIPEQMSLKSQRAFFAACTTLQSDTRVNVSEEPEGLLCFSQFLYDFLEIPELKSQEASTCLFLVQHTDHILVFQSLQL